MAADNLEEKRQESLSVGSQVSRWARWVIVGTAAILAWMFMMLAAVWQGPFLALLFPAGWCLYVSLRQYRDIRDGVADRRG